MQARFYPVLAFAVVLMCAAIGCDSNPTGPSADFSTWSPDNGATLNGTFQGSASTFRASRAANEDDLTVRVLVEGEEVARVKVVNGRFTLRGLPEEFTLLFYDGETEKEVGHEDFEGVKPNQELDVVLTYDGSTVSVLDVRTGIDHQAGNGIELDGSASNIYPDETMVEWTGSLEVEDYPVGTRAGQTSIRKGNRSLTLDELPNGSQVHVRGVFEEVNGVMWVFAHEIKLQEEEEDTSDDKVTICHIPPGNPDNKKTKEVSADAVPAHLAHGDTEGPC